MGADEAATFGGAFGAPVTIGATADTAETIGATMSPAAPEGAQSGGPLRVGQSFGARYHIIKVLGVGGMGAVYQAWDAELGVAVALKVIRTDARRRSASSEAEKRFKQELLLARQVTHKNVVRIHDLGEIDGIKYITMPFVHGDDLSAVLRRDGRLPMARALHLARQIATGLAAAHEAGVVHRDLKPANVMIGAEDLALIMDFGISASADEAAGGGIVGTLEYMAPEQSKGGAADVRADIYAFGLILYEMLTGLRTTSATTARERIDAMKRRTSDGVPPIRSLDETIPAPLAALVKRSLERDPAARFATTAELVAGLAALDDAGQLIPIPARISRRTLLAAAVAVACLVIGTWRLSRGPAIPVEHEPVSVLIADFDNRSGDPVFTGSVEQAFAIAVEGTSFITAYPRADALKLARRTQVGEQLTEEVARLIAVREGIKVLLTGSIGREGSGYRVTVRAFDPMIEDDRTRPLATESTAVREKARVLEAVSTLAGRLRGELGDTTPDNASRAAAETFTTASLEAMQAYSRAQELATVNRNDEAMRAYQQAVSLDPDFGRAHAGIGVLHEIMKDEPQARKAYDEALKHLNRMTDREQYRTLGIYYNFLRNYEKAIETYRTLVTLYPADLIGHANLALAYTNIGNFAEAVTEVREVLRIRPKFALQRYNYAMYSMYAGDFQTAAAEAGRVLEESPSFHYAFLPIALSAAAQGDIAGALATYGKMEQSGAAGMLRAQLGRADLAMFQGRDSDALKLLRDAAAAAEKEGDTGILAQNQVALAQVYLRLGQKGLAADAALKAATRGTHESVLVPAARVLIAVGRVDDARKIAQVLENMLQTQTVAYARLITAEIALQQGNYVAAIEGFRDSIRRRDTWLARYLVGKTYAETNHPAEAMDELNRCVKRLGEATDAFFWDTPSLRYLPPVYYWLARVQQAMGVDEARKNYEQFLSISANADPPDPLAADARHRLAAR